MEQLKWNYLLEKEEEGGKDDDDDDNDNESNNDNTDEDNEINASSTATRNKKCKYNTIMPGDNDDMAKSNMAKSDPHLL